MRAAKHESLRKLCMAACLFLLAGVFRQMDHTLPPLPSAVCFLMTNLIYIALTLVWGISIRRRILHQNMRRHLLLSCTMAVLWLLLRAVKYRYFQSDHLSRMLWYGYYIPMIFAPLFGFLAALELGRREERPLSPRLRLLYLPAVLLLLGILTNDRHQLAFRFLTERMSDGADYAHGFFYYAVVGWAIGLMLASVGIILHKCRVSESRSRAWIPLCVFGGGALLSLASFTNIYTFHKGPECCCLTFIALWESCLQIGLVPTNGSYRLFFTESALAAQIADRNGQVLYRSKAAPILTREQMRAACDAPMMLSPDERLQSAPVHDGFVYWVENVAPLNRAKARLEETRALLTEENELVRAETALRKQQAEIEEKSRLYDRIASLLAPKFEKMEALLNQGDAALPLVCVIGAFVKRRSNLALICEGERSVSIDELTYCIRESLEYLEGCGVVCALTASISGAKTDGTVLQTAYDFFEDCVEAALPALSALMVRLSSAEGFSIRLMMQDAAALPDASVYAECGRLTIDEEDGASCLTLSFPAGGEQP